MLGPHMLRYRHFRHDCTVGRWRTGQSRPGAARVRRRVLNAGLGGILALILPPLLGVTAARAAAGQISEFAVTQGFIGAGRLALGSDGALYFGTSFPATIGRVTPSGQVSQFADPNTAATSVGLTVTGPDHNVWFVDGADLTQGKLGRITAAGQITEFGIPPFSGLRTGITDLAAGPDGNLWFTAIAFQARTAKASLVGRVNPATGAITEFPTPTTQASPGAITTGSDGNLWFPETNLPGVARAATH
jgi:virginiamycin B lyase